jgi:hypothetical protein
LVFISKDADGTVHAHEFDDTNQELVQSVTPIVGAVMGLISLEDIEKLAAEMDPNSSSGILVIEHLWAKKFQQAILGANGQLIADLRIPPNVVEAAEEASKSSLVVGGVPTG